MKFNFSNVKELKIPVNGETKSVKQITNKSMPGAPVIWKGTWEYTIYLGSYVSKVKYSVDNVNWTSITTDTTVEVDSEAILYIKAETYSSEPGTYEYSYTMTDYNFDITRTEANDGGGVVVYRRATPVVNTYSLSGIYTNGSINYYKQSAHTTVITSAKYGDTIYYVGTPNIGYTGEISGSIVVNESNMTLNKTSLTATKDYGSASRIYYTVTWKWQSSYGTWTTTTQSYEYGTTPSRTSPGIVTSGNTRQVFSEWDDLSPLYSDRTITAVYYTQYNITVESTRCTTPAESGWTTYGTVITWTASTDYSFAEGTTRTATIEETVTGEGIYSKSANYYYITVSSTNCSADVSNGYRTIGATITWTATSGNGDYYSFSNTAYTTTATATIEDGTSSYSKSADYIYWYITVNATNCYVSAYHSGYYLQNTTVTSTWTVNNSNTQTFSSSQTTSTTTTTKTWTATKNGEVSSPTVYTRLYTVTFSATNGSWTHSSLNVEYNTSVSKSGTKVTVGSTANIFNQSSDTYQYSYSSPTVGEVPSKITKNETISGWATITDKYYTIIWKNWDGTVLETDTNVIHDANPSYDGPTPSKPSSNTEVYTYSGWSPNVSTVTGNATYIAQFTSSTRYYTATVTAGDYVTRVRIRVSGGNWGVSGASASCQKTYNQVIIWEATQYKTDTAEYVYSGAVSGRTGSDTKGDWSKTVNRTRDIHPYTLSISVTNGEYGWYEVKRTSSPRKGASTGVLSNGSTIYYGDVLTGSSGANGARYTDWDCTSADLTIPTVSVVDALYPTIKAIARNTVVANLYRRKWEGSYWGGWTHLSDTYGVAQPTSIYNDENLNWNTTYQYHVARYQNRNRYDRSASSSNYTGTSSVSGNVTASFSFSESGANLEQNWISGNPDTVDIATGSPKNQTVKFQVNGYWSGDGVVFMYQDGQYSYKSQRVTSSYNASVIGTKSTVTAQIKPNTDADGGYFYIWYRSGGSKYLGYRSGNQSIDIELDPYTYGTISVDLDHGSSC